MSVYCLPGIVSDYHNREIVHSQGVLKDYPINLITNELHRIETYTKKGDLLNIEEILNYLQNRKLIE